MATAAKRQSTARAPSRSQSPLPPPPEENAPGHRATALQNALAAALDATVKKCSYDNFASCFPTTAQYQAEILEGFWKDFVGKLSASCSAEFKDILDNRNVVTSLNLLDHLVADAKGRKEEYDAKAGAEGGGEVPVPPHILPASDILNAHLTPFLLEQQSHLTSSLDTLQEKNTELSQTISAQRAEMETLVSGLEAVVADLEKSAATLQDGELQKLSGDVRMIEDELKE